MTAPLAPALGRLAAPVRGGASFEATRLALVDRLVHAHHQGRLDAREWLAAWQEAVEEVVTAVMAEGREALLRAATASRYPTKRLTPLLPDAADAEELRQRLLAEGVALERMAEVQEPGALRWRGASLESGWDAAVRVAMLERQRWRTVASEVAAWRRPWRPLLVVASLLLLVATLLAAMLGGVIAAPRWFTPVTEWFWSLPWP